MAETIVVGGSIAQKPGFGGHTWVFLQYLLGLKQLGWDVLFLDRLEPEMCVDEDGCPCSLDRSVNLRYFLDVMDCFGLGDSFSLQYDGGNRVIGLPRKEVLGRTRQAALLLNVMGFIDDEGILGAAQQRVFLDIDPGFGQMWCDLGLHDPFTGHETFVSVGQNIGHPECAIPDCGRCWISIFPPVVMDHWPAEVLPSGDSITTIASWRGAYGPIDYKGKTYGLRVHEFRTFAEIPRHSGRHFEVALDIHRDEVVDRQLLTDNEWSLIDPRRVVGDPWTYRRYIQSSLAEFSVAKNMYVQTQSGWFSDRSACYLASGRPVVAQDTGFSAHLPTGSGLLPFTTPDEALAALECLDCDLGRHRRDARDIAREFFDSDKVLTKLLGALAIT